MRRNRGMLVAMFRSRQGFTLLELLAAVTLLMILGTLLFQVFDQASTVMRIGGGRQEVFEYVRVLFETLHRELGGVIGVRDAGPDGIGTPFRISSSQGDVTTFEETFGVDVREGSDTLSFTSALVGRDTLANSPTRGQVANVARVAYWLTPGDRVLNRYESYDVRQPAAGRGWEFALNVLEFRIEVLDQWTDGIGFEHKDWDSRDTVASGARRGMPGGLQVTIKLTDGRHVNLYVFDPSRKCMVLKPGVDASDDPVVQKFSQVIYLPTKQ